MTDIYNFLVMTLSLDDVSKIGTSLWPMRQDPFVQWDCTPVSYTHPTLPTNLRVLDSGVGGTLKKTKHTHQLDMSEKLI